MSEKISLNEREKLHPHQWVKLYGNGANPDEYEYINTCQVYQLDAVLTSISSSWWNNYVLEPVDENEQPMSLEEALNRGRESL